MNISQDGEKADEDEYSVGVCLYFSLLRIVADEMIDSSLYDEDADVQHEDECVDQKQCTK